MKITFPVVLLLLFLVSPAALTASPTSVIQQNEAVDLTLHLFAHMDLGDSPASLYDPNYITSISRARSSSVDLEAKLQPIAEHVRNNMNMQYLTFFSVYYSSVPSFLIALDYGITGNEEYLCGLSPLEQQVSRQLNHMLASSNQQGYLATFKEIAAEEYEAFYREYRRSRQEEHRKRLTAFQEFWLSEGLPAVEDFFADNDINSFWLLLSEGMRRNGRGFQGLSPGQAGAVVLLPENDRDLFYSYSFAIHEMLHQVTDRIVFDTLGINPAQHSIDPNDPTGLAVHQILENAVILTQFHLMNQYSEDFAQFYLAEVSDLVGMDISSYNRLRDVFRVDAGLEDALLNLVSSQ